MNISKQIPPAKVTALLPAYQASQFIQPTLDSLSAQTHENFNVIISIDASNDATKEICLAHAKRDARFNVVVQSKRLGWVGNSNFLLRQARSDYAFFAFHDDCIAPDYITKLAGVLDARSEVVLTYSDLQLTELDGKKTQHHYDQLIGLQNRIHRAARLLQRRGDWWVPNRGLFRMAAAHQVGGLKRHGAGEFSSDLPWLMHMSLLGEFHRIPETLCFKYYQVASLSRTWEFSAKQHREVSASCLREIWNARISTQEKLVLANPVSKVLTTLCERAGLIAPHAKQPQPTR